MVDNLAAHAGVPEYLDPRVDLIVADLAEPGCCDRRGCRRRRGMPPGGQGRAWVSTSAMSARTSPTTTSGPPACWRRCGGASSPAGWSWPAAWWSTARGGTAAPTMATCAPAPEPPPTWPPAASTRRARSPAAPAGRAWATIDESAPVDPRNVYAATKLHQEHLCALWAREAGATAVALRYHNVYGPRMPRDTPYAGVAVDLPQRGRPPAGRPRSTRTVARPATSCT